MSNEGSNQTDVLSAYPAPNAVRADWTARAQATGAEFSEVLLESGQELTQAREAAGWLARRREFGEARAVTDQEYEVQIEMLGANGLVLQTEIELLLQKGRELRSGALRKAQKRVEQEAKAIQEQISELTGLRDALKDILDMGIDLQASDVDGTATATNKLTVIEEKIAELETKVANDPVLSLVTEQLALIDQSVVRHEDQMDANTEEKAQTTETWKTGVAVIREGIDTTRQEDRTSATDAFNSVSEARYEAVFRIVQEGQQAVARERTDYGIIKALERRNAIRTSFNTVGGAWNGFISGIKALLETVKTSTTDGYKEETEAAAKRSAFLAGRAERIAAANNPAP